MLAERSLKEDSSSENIRKWAAKAVDRYEVELVNHFEMEEQLLFPAHPGELAQRLIGEHRQMESFVERLRSEPDRSVLENFLQLLRSHIRLEENEFFESAQRSVPAEELRRIGAEIDRRAVRVCL